MKAKLLKLLLAIVCLLCSIGVYAHDFKVDGIYYNKLSSTEVEVSYRGYSCDSYKNEYTGAVVIPASITYYGTTYNVTSIGYGAFYWCEGLTEVFIPNSVIFIENYAFAYCSSLNEITIPNSVFWISEDAFSGCTGLTTLNFNAEKCTYMGSSSYLVFEGCTNLKTLNIGESVKFIPDYAFYGCTGLTEVAIGNSVTWIGESAFEDCTGLIEITIPNSVTSIDESAFEDCTGLTEVAIGNSVTSIANYAFKGCTGLKSLTIEDGDSTLELGYNNSSKGEGLFYDCPIETLYIGRNLSYSTASNYGYSPFAWINELKTVTIGNSVTSIGNYAFLGCTGLKSLTIEDGDSTLELGYNNYAPKGEGLFYDCPIETLYIGRNLSYDTYSSYGYSPFYSINKLKSVTIGNSVTKIGYYSFKNCTGLTEISIPNSVTSIGDYAFEFCTGLTEVAIGNSVTSIGYEAFYNCTGLTEVTIPNSVTSIGSSAFEDCTGLTEVTIPNSVISIGESAFNGCTSMTKAIIGNGVTSISSYAFRGCASLDSIYIGCKVATVGENAFSGCKKLSNITIPAGVTTIDDYVFSGCTSLSDVVIEDRTTALSLGSNGSSGLFAYCPLDSVYIGGKITYKTSSGYGYSPFYRNASLRTVVITDTETEIYDNEFYGCSNLTKVTIGDGVKKIGNWAFSGCSSLDHFAFGTNVESIGQEAFSDCTNVTNIRSYSAVPPVCGTQALDDINKWDCTLSVLENCQSAYQAAEQWKEFFFVDAMDKDGKVATPIIEVDGVIVTMSCNTVKATIHYTTDGSEPTEESALYTGPFEVDKNCTIKAIAVRTNYYNSDISTAQVDYFVYAESIAIDYEMVSIRLNESVALTATVLPETTANKVVAWSSSDESIATIENGIVTAHAIGEATITATTTDGTNLSATCKVIVLPILADTITLDQSAVTLKATETTTLTATVLPETTTNKEVVWSSSDSEVASVENGVVTAHKVGTATIIATTTDGSNLSATCEVTVETTLATSITLDQTNITAMEGETVVLTATIYPDDTTEKGVVWSVSDATIATIEPLDNLSAKITVLKKGIATITAETIDGSNLSATCTIDVYSDIEALLRDSEAVEYYDLNGFRVENPTRGIYIVKHGDIVRKVFINKAR